MSFTEQYDVKQQFMNVANGDEAAFKLVYESYRRKVYGVAFKMLKSGVEAEEIVQEVFLSIWVGRGKLANVSDPEAYLFSCAYHAIYANLKKKSRNRQLIDRLITSSSIAQNTTEDAVSWKETSDRINDAVQQLPPQQRTAYQLSRHDNLSYEEIAEQMQLSKNTVRNHLSEALKTIRTLLNKTAVMFLG